MNKLSWLFVLSRFLPASLAVVFNENKLSSIVNESEFLTSLSRCTEISAAALFVPSNDLTFIVAVDASHRSADIINDILQKRFPNRTVKVLTKFSVAATPRSGSSPTRESSFVVIGSYSNLPDLMLESSAERWAEYIIVTGATTAWMSNFTNVLQKNKFRNVAFIDVSTEGRHTLIRPMENPSSPDLPPILKSSNLCNENDRVSSGEISTVYRFSSWLLYPMNRTVRFARILEGTEDPKKFDATADDGLPTSFGVDVLRIFTKRRNIKLERYEWPNQSESSWTEAMERCLKEEFDFFYAVLPPSPKSADGNLDAVVWYKHEILTFVDAVRKPDLTLSDIFIPFHSIVWICTVVLFAAFAAFAYAIDTFWQWDLIRERITILTIWSVFVGHTLPRVPAKFGLRFVLGMWLVHNLMRNAGYSALFSSSLTAMDDSHFLKTFQDILDTGKIICGSGKSKQLLNDTKDPVVYEIFKRLTPIPPMKVLDAIFNEGCIGTRHLTFIKKHNMQTRANESLRLYILSKATIINYPSFYFAKKHNPYNKELKRTILRAHEVGLVGWTAQKYTVKLDKTSAEMPMSADAGVLKLEHLVILFKLFLVGQFVSILVFILEICVYEGSVKKHPK